VRQRQPPAEKRIRIQKVKRKNRRVLTSFGEIGADGRFQSDSN
jgi:hypothetical protein